MKTLANIHLTQNLNYSAARQKWNGESLLDRRPGSRELLPEETCKYMSKNTSVKPQLCFCLLDTLYLVAVAMSLWRWEIMIDITLAEIKFCEPSR